MSDATIPDAEQTPKPSAAWPVWTIAIAFAILYSGTLWLAIGNAVNYPQMVAAAYNLGISPAGWVLLVIGVILSPLVYLVCLLLGRRRGLVGRALLYATGLCGVSAVMSSIMNSDHLVIFIA
jgi:hypothetical protein